MPNCFVCKRNSMERCILYTPNKDGVCSLYSYGLRVERLQREEFQNIAGRKQMAEYLFNEGEVDLALLVLPKE